MFPHRCIPHDVWLDTAGQLIATAAEQVTRENINLVLAGKYDELKFKVDMEAGKPLFLSAELLKNNQVKH